MENAASLNRAQNWNRCRVPLALALLGAVINIIVAVYMAPTIDEPMHISYAGMILKGKPDRPTVYYDSKVPISVLNALPRAAGVFFRDHHTHPRLAGILLYLPITRYATIAASFCLCLLVFAYADALFGRAAALFAQLIYVIEPNLIAHGTLSTTDLYIAAAAVLFLYCLRSFLLEPSVRNAALTAFALALAQLTKFIGVYLYFALAIVLIAVKLCERFAPGKPSRIPPQRIALLLALNAAFLIALLNIGYTFDRTFTPLAGYRFRTPAFEKLQQIPVLRSIPVPVPYPVLQGMDWINYDNSTARAFGNVCLLNQVRGPTLPHHGGFLDYYLVAYALKEPLGFQLILLLSLTCIFRKRRFVELLPNEGLLLISAVVILVPLSLGNTQIGIRHMLPVLAFFTILSGAAFQGWRTFTRRRRFLLGGCLLYAAISVASYFPHMIPYFNEIVYNRRFAYLYLAASNLDYGQAQWVANRFLKANPDVIFDPQQPVSGRFLLSGSILAGHWPTNADNFARVQGLKPVAQVGYAYFLFDVPPPSQPSH
jgi:4-amino-4-deoxy-L-arabinose transferase-like glycosyltransferase